MSAITDPKVSIVVPSLNRGKYIRESIDSVLAQSYDNVECIVVDGGSSDNTMEIVDQYHDRLSAVIHEKDRGQADAINKGFKVAKGDLVGWVNSDDILYPDCVEEIVKLYRRQNDGAIYYSSYYDTIDASSNKIKTHRKLIPDRRFLLNINYDVVQPGSFYSAEVLRRINYLDAGKRYCMDLDLWLRLLEQGPIYYADHKSLSGYREWDRNRGYVQSGQFLGEIRNTLLEHGAHHLSPNVRRTYWYQLKHFVRSSLG